MEHRPTHSAPKRLERLRLLMPRQEVDGLLVTNEKDIHYLTGFIGHDSVLLVPATGPGVIVSDARYDEFLDPWRQTSFTEVVMGVRHRLEESVGTIATARNMRSIAVQSEAMSISAKAKLINALKSINVMDSVGLVSQLRMVKDEGEVASIERAAKVQQEAMDAALARLAPGMTELQFCAVLEYEMKMRGSFKPSFDTMVCSGPNSSVIHYQTSKSVIQEGVLLVDWGAIIDGYCSDMTRTFSIGPMPEKIAQLYTIVLDAQLAAIDAMQPGKPCAEIDEVARKIIRDAGYGEHFGHGLGHGLGLDVHEPPYFNSLQTDVVLQPGMVMTVEPGIYLPGVGGVRIEDDVLVTDNGSRVLCTYPKRLNDIEIDFRQTEHDEADATAFPRRIAQ